MQTNINIFNTNYGFCRSTKASYSDKFNRMVKLANSFEYLSNKFDGMIERGSYMSITARLALATKMMMYTGIRIGNESSAEGYMTKPHKYSKDEPKFVQTYGLTTIIKEHVQVQGDKVYFYFLGKKHVDNIFVVEGKLATQIKKLMETYTGKTLFGITNHDLVKFIKKSVGIVFTPKDFRTMKANMLAFEAFTKICEKERPSSKSKFNTEIRDICIYVAENLNNTPGVCKASYIDPKIWEELKKERLED